MFWLGIDVLGAAMLLCAGLFGLRAWRSGASAYWLFAGAGLVYLAVDERLSLHEHMGSRLWDAGVPTPFGMNHLDDAILACFAIIGLAVTLAYLPELLHHPRVLRLLAVGGAFTAAALLIDARAPVEGLAPKVEELLELCGQAAFLAAFAMRWSEGGAARWPRLGRFEPEATTAEAPVAATE